MRQFDLHSGILNKRFNCSSLFNSPKLLLFHSLFGPVTKFLNINKVSAFFSEDRGVKHFQWLFGIIRRSELNLFSYTADRFFDCLVNPSNFIEFSWNIELQHTLDQLDRQFTYLHSTYRININRINTVHYIRACHTFSYTFLIEIRLKEWHKDWHKEINFYKSYITSFD